MEYQYYCNFPGCSFSGTKSHSVLPMCPEHGPSTVMTTVDRRTNVELRQTINNLEVNLKDFLDRIDSVPPLVGSYAERAQLEGQRQAFKTVSTWLEKIKKSVRTGS